MHLHFVNKQQFRNFALATRLEAKIKYKNSMTKYAIIVAGGSGHRFGSQKPKQFCLLAGKPVLMHTIEKFAAVPNCKIILVLPENFIDWWADLCSEYQFTTEHSVVAGGNSRFASVKNAISTITNVLDGDTIAVHDGVRPLISTALIEKIFSEAATHASAIPATEVTDSIRQTDANGHSTALCRASLRAVQTPQTFDAKLLIDAYNVPYAEFFTDDASVFEHAGHAIHLVEGEVNNIKITHPNDIFIAEFLLKK